MKLEKSVSKKNGTNRLRTLFHDGIKKKQVEKSNFTYTQVRNICAVFPCYECRMCCD